MTRSTFATCALALTLAACTPADSSNSADLVLFNGNVITVDSTDAIAHAIAVKDGKIVAVGSDSAALTMAGRTTQRVDLKGLTVTPGLLDAHAHFANGGTARLFVLDLSYPNAKSIGEIKSKVSAKIEATTSGGWVLGNGWDEGKLEERRMVTAADLDEISPRHPVWLEQTMGHYGVANSLALKLAGVTKETKDPPGGTIDRNPDGTPTGVLKESAQGLVHRLLPDFTPAQQREAMKSLAAAFNEEGMTGLKDPGIGQQTWDNYKQVESEGGLTVRVFALWQGGRTMAEAQKLIADKAATTKPYESTGDDHVIAGGVKLYIDGSGGARTAWLYDDWNKNLSEVDRGNRGYPAFSPDTLRAMVKAYHNAGFHISVHSIGDRAIDWTMDSYAEALKANPQTGRRHGIIHANIPTDRAIDMMADFQKRYDAAFPEPSATFMWWIGDTYAGNFGPKRARRLDPFKTFQTKGIRWAGGSDYGVTPFPARYGIWASVAREPMLGIWGKDVYGKEESVDVHTALKSFTIWAARQMFLEKKAGSIEVGKYADLAVWDRDLYTVPTEQLKEMQCQLTVFNGKIVYRREGAKLVVEGASR
jgi:hypothetical protein